ncbi:MAG TPA: Nif3-like dinuclear metal center hexameric protein [Candidatus Lokiarchaeia archaeon]|nr:Nif3-like dinuclear metal center hexameric protein [Candidatus Lokiarchaeia archaeon]
MYLDHIISSIEDTSPSWLSLDDDSCKGLCFGRKSNVSDVVIRKCLIAVDPSLECIDKAVEFKANLIVSHHALFAYPFLDIKELIYEKFRLLTEHNIWVYVIGNSWNAASQGITESTCQALKLEINDMLAIPNATGLAIPIGRICDKDGKESFESMLKRVKMTLGETIVRYGGRLESKPKKVLVIGGILNSIKLVNRVLEENVDTIIAGEITSEIRGTLLDLNENFIEISHYATDILGMSKLRMLLSSKNPNVIFELYDKDMTHFL